MKIIHMSDLHLGSAFADLPVDKRSIRAAEVASSLKRAVDYAKKNGVQVILLSGDVFDGDRPRRSDREFFYGVIEANPEIDFLYLRGNHDTEESFSRSDLKNLKTFSSDGWTKYEYGDTVICGAELPHPCPPSFYSSLVLAQDKFNIVMLHGQISRLRIVGSGEISIPLLQDKNIDYLALGHIHSYSSGEIDGRGIYVYSGCPEGKGYDESGDKGFVEIDTSSRRFVFVKSAVRDVVIREADISGAEDFGGVVSAVINSLSDVDEKSVVRSVITGETRLDIAALLPRIKDYFSGGYFSFDVKADTKQIINAEDYSKSASLKGEFYRLVMGDDDLSEEEKNEILRLGLKAFDGEEL